MTDRSLPAAPQRRWRPFAWLGRLFAAFVGKRRNRRQRPEAAKRQAVAPAGVTPLASVQAPPIVIPMLPLQWGDDMAANKDTVIGLLAGVAERTPEAAAIIHGQRSYSYAELMQFSARAAQGLAELGVGRG